MLKQIFTAIAGWILSPFSWSKWVDIQTFSFLGEAFLLQASVNKISNAKKFRVQKTRQNNFSSANVGILKIEELEKRGLTSYNIDYFNF